MIVQPAFVRRHLFRDVNVNLFTSCLYFLRYAYLVPELAQKIQVQNGMHVKLNLGLSQTLI